MLATFAAPVLNCKILSRSVALAMKAVGRFRTFESVAPRTFSSRLYSAKNCWIDDLSAEFQTLAIEQQKISAKFSRRTLGGGWKRGSKSSRLNYDETIFSNFCSLMPVNARVLSPARYSTSQHLLVVAPRNSTAWPLQKK